MKKFGLIFLCVLGTLGVAIFVVGLFLPSSYTVERSVIIDASPQVVHVYVDDLNKWPAWAPWLDEDPSIVTTIGTLSHGVGASQSWTGETGSGELTLTASNPSTGIEYDLSIDDGKFRSIAGLSYVAVDARTEVTWAMRGDVGYNIVGRYFALGMDGMVGPMFERGMSKLKMAVESGGN